MIAASSSWPSSAPRSRSFGSNTAMSLASGVRTFVSLGRTARSAAKTKVRTPLAKLIAVFDPNDRDRGALEGQDELAAIIRDELNVKAFEVRDDAKGLVRETVKPELKALGPKLGKDLPRVRQALADGRYTQRDGNTVVEGFTLSPGEVLVSHEGTPGHAVGRDAGAIAALVTETTPELEAEGLARELAHHVNNMRKEAGLDIADRIALRYEGDLGRTIARSTTSSPARSSRRRSIAASRDAGTAGRASSTA